MKKNLLIAIFIIAASCAKAQTPQSVCYQAVATDQSGHELINQNIRVRLSILRNSSGGNPEWIEEQGVTTDGFGLFNLNIGQGVRAGGVQTSFSGIKWGADIYFLKVEMDPVGGSNYMLMGTSQLLSVPYALYTDKAGYADSARISFTSITANTAIKANYADSARISLTSITANTAIKANYADSSRISNISNTAIKATYSDSSRTSYTSNIANYAQTSGMALRTPTSDTAKFAWLADSARRAATAVNATNAQNAVYSQTSGSAQSALSAINAQNATNSTNAQNAVNAQSAVNATNATNATNAVNAQTANSALNSVNANNALNAIHANKSDTALYAIATGQVQALTYNSGTLSLSNPLPNGQPWTVNFGAQAFGNPGASIEFPLGIVGTAILITSNFTVPPGKSLYISAVSSVVTLTGGVNLIAQPGMPIIPQNVQIASCYCSGILIDNPATNLVQTLIIDLSGTNSYSVPAGYALIIKSGIDINGRLDIAIDGVDFSFYTTGSPAPRLVVIPTGKTIRNGGTNASTLMLSGYLYKQ